jgi:hypothetical protein
VALTRSEESTVNSRAAVLRGALGIGLIGTLTVAVAPAGAATAPPAAAGAFAQPTAALGSGWSSSTDQITVGVGDSNGFHILVAREHDAFTWTNPVSLDVPELDMGPWTGEVCTTGDGKYAIAVYAPSSVTNHPALAEAGAFAAAIDLTTGKATALISGVQLAYHTPGCGLGDDAVLTRALGADEQQTQLIDVNAATAQVTGIKTVHAQVTNAVPVAGHDYGIVDAALARIGDDGSVTKVAELAGRAYSLVVTNRGIDTVVAASGNAIVQHWDGAHLRTLGSGDLSDLQFYPQNQGTDLLVGDTAKIAPLDSSIRLLRRGTLPDAVSRQGDLVADRVESEQIAAMTRPQGTTDTALLAGRIDVSVTATRSSSRSTGVTLADGPRSTSVAPVVVSGTSGRMGGSHSPGAAVPDVTVRPLTFTSGGSNPAADGDYEVAVDLSTATDAGNPTCLVPRNTPTDQVLQPTSAMAEWAVDQAVHGDLTVSRPANFLNTGQAAYKPQVMFPPVSLSGPVGGTIPAQVELGILAQESNFKQASWHAVAGDSGNPLISDYYGTALITGTADNPNAVPDYTDTDCGYGIGQVTDGMSNLDAAPMSTSDATAVATDYAANIAASVQILGQAWNQLATMSPAVLANGGDPKYIENWFLAIWGYNSGVYDQSTASAHGGHYGVGWFNNPANPNYPANRGPFLDDINQSNDAAVPQYWSYEEKVMGWIVHPQLNGSSREYALPTFGTSVTDTDAWVVAAPTVDIPEDTTRPGNFFTFCSPSVNSCSSATPSNPCPNDDSSCWWNQPVTWISGESTSNATTEHLSYALGSGEPAMAAQYPADCPNKTAFYTQFPSGGFVVTDLNNPNDNNRGCSWGTTSDGKFTIRLGDNISLGTNEGGAMQANPLTAQIDLHQIGAGFLGHFYFTHTYDSGTSTVNGNQVNAVPSAITSLSDGAWTGGTSVAAQIQHRVVGTWTPNIPYQSRAQTYAIIVSVPDHGANAPAVTYRIDLGTVNGQALGSTSCTISQASNGNRWVYLGTYTLSPGADVSLSNMVPGANGTKDVAFGTVVFEDTNNSVACGASASVTG